MNSKELYVVCQIDDYSLKVMANCYWNGEIQVLFKESISNQQFAENGIILDVVKTGQILQTLINKINQSLKIKILRVSLSLPSNNLKIYQSQASLDFKATNHRITHRDLNQVLEMSQKIQIPNDEVICLTKPYNFKVDNKPYGLKPPYEAIGQAIFVESLIYTIPKSVYDSQLAVLNHAKTELMSVTVDQFALAFNVNSTNEQAKNMVLIDWGNNQTKISIFTNSTLYAINNIKIGFKHIVKSLMAKMQCDYEKAEKYLTRIVNINSNHLNDLVLEKFYDENQKNLISLTKRELQTTICDILNEIFEHIEYFLNDILKNDPEILIVVTGKTTTLPGFTNYLKNYQKFKNFKCFTNEIPGANNYKWSTLVGTTYYQHNLNLYQQKPIFLTSITNEILINNHGDKNNQNSEQTIITPHINLNYHYNK